MEGIYRKSCRKSHLRRCSAVQGASARLGAAFPDGKQGHQGVGTCEMGMGLTEKQQREQWIFCTKLQWYTPQTWDSLLFKMERMTETCLVPRALNV